jgi:hypothetical protein
MGAVLKRHGPWGVAGMKIIGWILFYLVTGFLLVPAAIIFGTLLIIGGPIIALTEGDPEMFGACIGGLLCWFCALPGVCLYFALVHFGIIPPINW